MSKVTGVVIPREKAGTKPKRIVKRYYPGEITRIRKQNKREKLVEKLRKEEFKQEEIKPILKIIPQTKTDIIARRDLKYITRNESYLMKVINKNQQFTL